MKWRWLERILTSPRRSSTSGSGDSDGGKVAEVPAAGHAVEVSSGSPSAGQAVEEASASGALSRAPSPPKEPRRPASLDAWETVVDRIIREAMERGEFDNLRGAGKPLKLDDNPFAGDWELGFHLLKQNGFTLPWIELGREIEADREALREMLDRAAARLNPVREGVRTATERRLYEAERVRYREQYLKAAADLDQKLGEYSAEVPAWWMDQGRLPAETAARRFDITCPPL